MKKLITRKIRRDLRQTYGYDLFFLRPRFILYFYFRQRDCFAESLVGANNRRNARETITMKRNRSRLGRTCFFRLKTRPCHHWRSSRRFSCSCTEVFFPRLIRRFQFVARRCRRAGSRSKFARDCRFIGLTGLPCRRADFRQWLFRTCTRVTFQNYR